MGEVIFADFKRKQPMTHEEVVAQAAHVAYRIGMSSKRLSQETLEEMQTALKQRLMGLTEAERNEVERLAREKISGRTGNLGRKAMEDK